MNILFLGGNRFFGKKLLEKISNVKKFNIFVINRGNKKIDLDILKKKNVNFIKCDRKNGDKLKKHLKKIKFEIIFDNCAYHLNDVKILLNSIIKTKKMTYIFSSSVMTYLNLYLKKDLNEKDWFKSNSSKKMSAMYKDHEIIYAKNKRKIENYLIKNKKIQYIILRIHNVVGEFDFSKKTSVLFNSEYDQLKKYKIKKEDFFQFTYDKDLVDLIYKFFLKKITKSDVFNVCNNPVNVKDFLKKKKGKLKKNLNDYTETHFPFPVNVIMNNKKIKRKLRFNFTSINKIIYALSKSEEFK